MAGRCCIQGLKPAILSSPIFGTTEVVPCYKAHEFIIPNGVFSFHATENEDTFVWPHAYSIPSPAVEEPLTANHSTATASPRLPHNLHTFHRPSRRPCGSHGKIGLLLTLRVPVIQISSSPQPRFRKLAPVSTPLPNAISPQFPLFLSELRVLLVFLYLSLYLSTTLPPPCTLHHPHRAPRPAPIATQAAFPTGYSLWAIPVIQRTTPVFHARFTSRIATIRVMKRDRFRSSASCCTVRA